MTNLCFVTWNTNGIKKRNKFSGVLQELRDLKADVAFIQETHIGPEDDYDKIFTAALDWKVYFTVHHYRSKGVAVMINKTVKFEYICHDEDCSGGYFVLFCYLYDELYTLVNVYNHKDDKNLLGRLKEYLMETAAGVLVIGGDFNTVLNPCVDRHRPSSRTSPFRGILEDFIVSLNLRDIWSCLHFAEGFTRKQNDSQSRIDMFFTRSDEVDRVSDITVTVKRKKKSDHKPLVLEFKVQTQTKKITTILAIKKTTEDDEQAKRISWKISGAEILIAIKTLPDSQEQKSDQHTVGCNKEHRWQVTEELKIKFNEILKTNAVWKAFTENDFSGQRGVFDAKYLIFSQILAKRLEEYIFPSVKKKLKTDVKFHLTVTFKKDIQKCKLSFIMETLTQSSGEPAQLKKLRNFAPPEKFRILEKLLPEDSSSSDLRHLLPGCPLTNVIMNLALNKLNWIFNTETNCMSSVCFQRQTLNIHEPESEQNQVSEIVQKFQDDSGLTFEIRS